MKNAKNKPLGFGGQSADKGLTALGPVAERPLHKLQVDGLRATRPIQKFHLPLAGI